MSEEEDLRTSAAAREILEEIDSVAEPTPLVRLFHRVWSVIPDTQEIADVSPDASVGDALAKMAEHDFSQLPVRVGTQVLGLFSYRSFARRAPEQIELMARLALPEMPVEGFAEAPVFVSPYDELSDLLSLLDTEDAVLVGTEEDLQGVLTTVDVLRWLHELAEPFVRLGETERSLREIVTRKLSPEQISECARRSLEQHYQGREERLPTAVEAMTFDELRLVVIDGRNWPLIEPALGRNIELAKSHLKRLPSLRNDVFHFRRDLHDADLGVIRTARRWLLGRLRILEENG